MSLSSSERVPVEPGRDWGVFRPDGTAVLPPDATISIVRGNMPDRKDLVTQEMLSKLGFAPPAA